jgi:hypothetical protein
LANTEEGCDAVPFHAYEKGPWELGAAAMFRIPLEVPQLLGVISMPSK